MVKICICGGGALGHVCAGILSSQKDVEVNLYTHHPFLWQKKIAVRDINGKQYFGEITEISSNPAAVISGCDIVFLCLPGFAIEATLQSIKPYLGRAIVGSIVCSTGFFFTAHRILKSDSALFGFQRVPFIARVVEYGHTANLLGYKPEVAIATENIRDVDQFRQLVEKLWLTPCKLLSSFFEVSLTNSNPILHTGRLYSLWKDWNGEVSDHNILFYKEWTDEASQLLIDMDAEFIELLHVLPVTRGSIVPLLEYYDSYDAPSLTKKISSIQAFQNIQAPMIQIDGGGWIPDFKSRYFIEDFPYGLKFIYDLAVEKGIACSNIENVFKWGMDKCKM